MGDLASRNKLNNLTAKEWIPETISVYVQKGLGHNHKDTKIERQHPAPFSFQDVGRLVRFFSKKGEKVLDPFCGVGSTLKACALNDRDGVGFELVEKYVELTKERLQTELELNMFNTKQEILHGDAFELIKKYKKDTFDFIVTSPPYWNILQKSDHKVNQTRKAFNLDTKYSNLTNDLGNIDKYEDFLEKLCSFFSMTSSILKSKKYLCIVVSDFRNKDKFYMFHADLANMLEKRTPYRLKGITVLYQRHKRIFPYGYPYSYVPNIHHQYIIILQNEK